MSYISGKEIVAVVLAAGKGTRMKSDLPKVLHELMKKPMLCYIMDTLHSMDFSKVLAVTGHGHELLKKRIPQYKDQFILQKDQLGTGHALQQAWPAISEQGAHWVLVVNGDTPLVTQANLQQLISRVAGEGADLGFLSLVLDDPAGYGRVLRDSAGKVKAVVEAKDYKQDVHGFCTGEVNSGIYLFKMSFLAGLLFELDDHNEQNELYITQLISLACERDLNIQAVSAGTCPELLGINTPAQLAAQEEYLRKIVVDELMKSGVIVRNQDQVRVGPDAIVEPGADITGPCEVYGSSFIGKGTRIHSHCYVEDTLIRESEIFSFSHLQKSVINELTTIGPFARLRPGTVIEKGARAGNFVEIKNSSIGMNSKVSHLSYIGDTRMESEVNVGAGTITCNYDGLNKHRTTIGQEVFIGSNTSLVSPVKLGDGCMVGAGSTITQDVPEGALAVSRSKQMNLANKNPLKKKQK
ncbi:MAG: bifunctional UDP-N-acetylglucosamine diphosphorylase/glucosamine-1-phosphate N-acetyltransferase GlmU [Desulfonatronovibrio sp.]